MDCREIIRHSLLKRGFHALWTHNGKIYVHGGVTKYNSKEDPLGDVVEFDPTANTVHEVHCKGYCPRRSHHKCIVIDGKWACVIGGWDGKQRVTEVSALDTETLEWHSLSANPSCEPPAGLSSHTCTKVGRNEIIITGREGGVRMQRRYGSVYKLTIDIHSKTYTYKEMAMHISSRSGHVACMISKDSKPSSKLSLVIQGGRDSDSPEIIGSWSKTDVNLPQESSQLEARLKTYMPPKDASDSKASSQLVPTKPRSLRHHAAIEAGQFCLLHGGEVFGKARDTVSGDIFVNNSFASKWWTVPVEILKIHPQSDDGLLKRMGHGICYMNGFLYIVSGIGSNGKTADGSICSIAL